MKSKLPPKKKVQIQDSSSSQSQLSDILEHPAFNRGKANKKDQITTKTVEKLKQDSRQRKQVPSKITNNLVSKLQRQKIQQIVKGEKVKHILQNVQQLRANGLERKKIEQTTSKEDGYQVCLQGLSFNAFGPDIRRLFQDCGKIIKLKVLTDQSGKSKGTAFAKFATKGQYQKALLLDGIEHMGRHIKITPGQKKEGSEHNWKQSFTTPVQQNKSQTLFIGNLPSKVTQALIYDHFRDCQEIIDVRIVKDRSNGLSKGFGYLQFTDSNTATKAFTQFNGSQLCGRHIRLDYAASSKKK